MNRLIEILARLVVGKVITYHNPQFRRVVTSPLPIPNFKLYVSYLGYTNEDLVKVSVKRRINKRFSCHFFVFPIYQRTCFALEENYDIPTPTLTAWCSTSELLKQFLYKYMTIFLNNQIFREFFLWNLVDSNHVNWIFSPAHIPYLSKFPSLERVGSNHCYRDQNPM